MEGAMRALLIIPCAMMFSGCFLFLSVEAGLKATEGGGYTYYGEGAGKTSGAASAAAMGSSGLTEYGMGVQALMGRQPGPGPTSFYGLASFHRYGFEGGHDNLLRLGAQARHRLGTGPWWAGGEVAWIRDTSVYDGGLYADDPASSGFSVGALGGYRLPLEGRDVSLYTGIGLLHFGDFKSGDLLVDAGGNSVSLRVGVEMGLPFGGR
jgi:hypothetical protein